MTLYKFGRVVVSAFFHIFFRLKIEGRENIPKEGDRFVICSNHKGYLDPPLIGLAMPYEIGYMAKEELFKFKPFAALIRKLGAFPIKRGASDFGALRSAIKKTKDGGHIVIFPEGGRSHEDRLRKGKMGAVLVAIKADADILPIGIDGTYRPFSKLTVKIGKPIKLDEYRDRKVPNSEMQALTEGVLMPAISELSAVPM